MNIEKIKAKKLGFKHIGKHIQTGDKFDGLYGTLDRLDMSGGDIEVYVYANQYGCGGYRMTLEPNDMVWVESK